MLSQTFFFAIYFTGAILEFASVRRALAAAATS